MNTDIDLEIVCEDISAPSLFIDLILAAREQGMHLIRSGGPDATIPRVGLYLTADRCVHMIEIMLSGEHLLAGTISAAPETTIEDRIKYLKSLLDPLFLKAIACGSDSVEIVPRGTRHSK